MLPRRPVDTRVRAARVAPPLPLIAHAQTIGAPMIYALSVDNASRTGVLLGMGRNKKVPYRVNTLLEMTIDPHSVTFEAPVQCLGKIVRLTMDDDANVCFGVQIVQMESKDALTWEKAMIAFEGETGKFLPESA